MGLFFLWVIEKKQLYLYLMEAVWFINQVQLGLHVDGVWSIPVVITNSLWQKSERSVGLRRRAQDIQIQDVSSIW